MATIKLNDLPLLALHKKNRARLVASMKNAGAKGVVVLEGGKSALRHDTDHEPLFRQESFFHWTFGVKEPDFFGLIDVESGKAILLNPRLPDSYATWMGAIYPPAYFQKRYGVDEAYYADEIVTVLNNLKRETLYTLKGVNSDSGNECQEAKFQGIEAFKVDNTLLYPHIAECRVIKTEEELMVMRYVNRVSSAAHIEVMKRVHPGMHEYQAEAIFQYHCYHDGACRNCSYTCICGSGENSAVLHYGHAAAPNDKIIQDGDMLLFDMGAEFYCYGSDITRSYPANGKFSPKQRIVYETVLAAQNAVMNAMKPGVKWEDMHGLAYRTILEELKKHGLLQGDVDEMIKHNVASLFMPHGLGHFLGLDTHDVGGYPKGDERFKEPGWRSLRTRRELREGMVITVEPGVYFIDFLLDKVFAENGPQAKYLVKEKIDEFRGFGGVRIEDDVLVTKTGIENLTQIPRTVQEIEAIMQKK